MHCRAPQALLVHSVTQRFGSDADLTPRWLGGQESTCQKPETGHAGSIPGREDPLEEEMAHSRLGDPMDRGAWQAAVHGVAKSRAWLSAHTHTLTPWA